MSGIKLSSLFDLSGLKLPEEGRVSAKSYKPSAHKKKGKVSTRLSAEILATFSTTVDRITSERTEKIERGELDRHGNPIGTRYWDEEEGAVRRERKLVGAGGRKRVKIQPGMYFGDLMVMRKGPRVRAARPNLMERWRCQCSCGKQIIVPKYYLLRKPNPKTHCGHKTATLKSQHPFEYRIYMMIHQRIYNPKHTSYEHYNKRGITLHGEWHNDHKDGFKKFFEHVNSPPVGPYPGRGYSLDRINNNRGYEPGNLRWATASQQRQNQGDLIGGYTEEEIADLGYTEEEFIEKIISGEIQ